ncbi:TPA: AmmeMemoRadiSam system protein B [Candidatus Uhrbacteria bacterium]|uniref:Capsule synthesis protein CapA domain-containing protein n=2 Tax=Candidatus Uhriibacteriota TaxID=1752732 RepID=A0A0G1Q9X4_9BACT|nr:MAG: hypothetical protein UX45_C0002G0008 [Candidatus Uhrbacteria bacterium GW2011_GWF2_46_218]KKU41784.1 MAG: hypothetical protein UX57_C0001G0008 [Candidatus Uhrbacteria bacterium GW2011_GWE2_46_68]HCB18763.1 AmmeMemoRadiSam system protein B [Candidatus Uhrbacteria bacterium]
MTLLPHSSFSWMVWICLFTGLFCLGIFLGSQYVFLPSLIHEDDSPLYSSGLQDQNFYESAYAQAKWHEEKNAVQSALAAHHLLVAHKIAETFYTIGNEDVHTIVLISPNHFSVGRSFAQISLGNWQTPYGILETDEGAVVELLSKNTELAQEEEAFAKEHGIAALTPFIKKSFPNAKLVPIIVHDNLTLEQATILGTTIAQTLPNALLIGSADMSHYLPEYIAAFHDEVTLTALAHGDCRGCELETDSNALLRILFAFNKEHGSQVWHPLYRGSSILMGATNDPEDNTSHILGYFTSGPPENGTFMSLTMIGDIMLDRSVRTEMEEHGYDYPWQNMERFLSGTHTVIGNHEGTVGDWERKNAHEAPYPFVFPIEADEVLSLYVDVVSLANNHTDDYGKEATTSTQETLTSLGIKWFGTYNDAAPRLDMEVGNTSVSFVGFNQFQSSWKTLVAQIEEASAENLFVIAYPHWGTEYARVPDTSQQYLASLMVEAGADLIVGGHPHVTQGAEMIDDVPVFYSMGNFIFDQPMPETDKGYAVGVLREKNNLSLWILPYRIIEKQPTPVSDQEAAKIFEELADLSSEPLRDVMMQGKITTVFNP